MENTASFLFDDKNAKYFVATMGKALGPLTAHGVFQRLQSGEVGLMHFIWSEGFAEWKRISDLTEFAILVPQKPSPASIAKIREKIARKRQSQAREITEQGEEKSYFLFFNNSQYGPFSKPELSRVLQSQKIEGHAFIWIPGWANWKPVSEVPDLAPLLIETGEEPEVRPASKDSKKSSRKDRRRAPRRPLVARLFVHNDEDVIVAVCRDISVGGMQVLTDRIPGAVGSVVKLNVSPADAKKVKGFVAEGEIVRVLEDGRGFSFRFLKISGEAKKMIESYIND